jgi:hypothetical protein
VLEVDIEVGLPVQFKDERNAWKTARVEAYMVRKGIQSLASMLGKCLEILLL